MTRLALLALAALLAAVAYVIVKPRWRWDPPTVDEVEPPYWQDLITTARGGTGSPWSVTSRSDNGTGLFV